MKVTSGSEPPNDPKVSDCWRRTDGVWFIWDGKQWYPMGKS